MERINTWVYCHHCQTMGRMALRIDDGTHRYFSCFRCREMVRITIPVKKF
jgi:hypothetical protein